MDKFCKAALKFANDFRQELGLEPISELPQGIAFSSPRCPLANAIGGGHTFGVYASPFTVYTWRRESLGPLVKHPPEDVVQFIRRFDRGLYPDLELRA